MINKVQENSHNINYSTHSMQYDTLRQKGKYHNVNFKSSKGLSPEVLEALNKDSKWWAKFLNYAGEHQGEVLNILVTAFGTAVICPLFIRYNPFSKEDKETRTYSAWRQPISAVISILTQLTITKAFNNWFAKKASTSNKDGSAGLCQRADLRAKPNADYLKRIIKLEHPEYDNKQISEEIVKRQQDAEKRVIAEARIKYKDKVITTQDMLCQESLDKAKERLFKDLITENQEAIKEKFGKSAEDVPSFKLNKFLEEKLEQKAKAQNITLTELIKQTAERTVEKEVIGETLLKTYIRELKNNGKNIQEAIDLCTADELKKYIDECIKRKPEFANNFKELSPEIVAQEVIQRLENIKEYESAKKLGKFTSVKDLGKTFDEILHNIKIKKMVKAQTKDAQKVFKTMNTQIGLIVTLITLPVSCGILNWSYPRIMEKIMPEMATRKKQTSGQTEKSGGDK